ncbi:hypothetical protein [Paraburkholderia mimosarum]|uniref:hypothetical protein n=1 Tax=Paraburkholderia mimosarum TaxID=312026 RepID=UPI000686A3C2|nr:hypothetical protein [Paraburkholderia mimosarum]
MTLTKVALVMELQWPPDEGFEKFAAAFGMLGNGASIGSSVKALPDLIRALRQNCPIKTAATFGALLTKTRLQSNCLRLEMLTHLCVAVGNGTRAPAQSLIKQGFNATGSLWGHMEDPPEDVFVGNISSSQGNYRVLEGIWESSTFYLQRIVNVVDSLPDGAQFNFIKTSVHALLKVSDTICERAGLVRNTLGSNSRNRDLPSSLLDRTDRTRSTVRFGFDELVAVNVDIEALEPFIFDPANRNELLEQSLGHTSLEAAPLAVTADEVFVLLPTAITVAVRRFVIDQLAHGPNHKAFINAIGQEYGQTFATSPFFGNAGPRLRFFHHGWGSFSAFSEEIDTGRYLQVVAFLDDLQDFEINGFKDVRKTPTELQVELQKCVTAMRASDEKRPGFKDGLTLMVSCGVGRGLMFERLVEPNDHWDQEVINAPDLITLGQTKGIDVLNLWRIRSMERYLEQHGVMLQNVNGLLNLYAWADSLDGHLVPHGDVPEEFGRTEGHGLIMPVTQNGLLNLRYRALQAGDNHVAKFVDETWKQVHRQTDSYFKEDNRRPLYVHLGLPDRRAPLGARITDNRCWWYESLAADGTYGRLVYERWMMMGVWVARIADLIEADHNAALGDGPLHWKCTFEATVELPDPGVMGAPDDLDNAFEVTTFPETRTVEISVKKGFDKAIYHPDNIAEIGLIRAFLYGVSKLTGVSIETLEQSAAPAFADPRARHSHIFTGNCYRDLFHKQVSRSPIEISKFDDALIKLGLGWQTGGPTHGARIEGKPECLAYLRSVVTKLQETLAENLKLFSRVELLEMLLENYERASHSRDWWHRTAASVLALREDKVAAMEAMSAREFKLNGVLQSTRNLIEMALCECPITGNVEAGALELSSLLAQSAQIFHLGGWSDLIFWDMMEPTLLVTPLGDVHGEHQFQEQVMGPLGKLTSETRFESSARTYEKGLEEQSFLESSADSGISPDFLKAWHQEFGVELDEFRRFVDALENHGRESGRLTFLLPQSSLMEITGQPAVGSLIVKSLTSRPRPDWKVPPDGYALKDISPWKFKRRLSLLRRPLLQVTEEEDPQFLIDPGLVRECLRSMLSNYYEGSYSDDHLQAPMRKYAGDARRRDGNAFNNQVAEKMKTLGWTVLPEMNVKKILTMGFERDFGDVDVLAYKPEVNRCLIIECKDLQFKKTYGEIAEQLSDYKGTTSSDGKKRDSLRKHLDRVELLRTHSDRLARFLGTNTIPVIESHLMFSHPVPMMFASHLAGDLAIVHAFDDIEDI